MVSKHKAVLLAILAGVLTLVDANKKSGTVTGFVFDEHGNPIAGAHVFAKPAYKSFTFAPYSTTDAQGAFRIEQLAWETYQITAEKESEGYGDTGAWFYAGQVIPVLVTLSKNRPYAETTVRFTARGGILILSSIDALTGKRLMPCVQLNRAAEHRDQWLRTRIESDNYRIVVPSDTDVEMKAWLPGYLSWEYTTETPSGASGVMRLKPAEERPINVVLSPDPSKKRSEAELLRETVRMVQRGCS